MTFVRKLISLLFLSFVAFSQKIDWNTQIKNRPVIPPSPPYDWNTQIFNKPTITNPPYDWIAQLSNRPFADVRQYVFTAQAPGGSLSIGSNTITLSPVPLGVNGTDANHYLYISNGTGTAESVLITGGTATSGSSSGTLTIVCANTHSGAWTIQSSSNGIRESASILGLQGVILLPIGTLQLYGTLVLPTTVSLIGQGTTTASSPTLSTILNCSVAANPCLVVADGNGTATNQGIGVHSQYLLEGPGSGTGLWIGGDPASVFAPTAWTGSYMHFNNIQVSNFTTALEHRNGNFDIYRDCVFGGLTTALYIPSTAIGGNHQPMEFYGTLLSVPSGNAVQMDDSGFQSCPIEFFGGQISGIITGADLDFESFGTHYEPNIVNQGLVNITGAGGFLKVYGGIMSVHGTALTSAINMSGTGFYVLEVHDVHLQADVGMTVTNFINYATTSGGRLKVSNVFVAPAGTFTNLVNISSTTLSSAATAYSLNQQLVETAARIVAATTITFPQTNYPISQPFVITGATVGGSGITTIAGLTPYSTGILVTESAQTFTASGTIGSTLTTTPGLPYNWYYDGIHFWIK